MDLTSDAPIDSNPQLPSSVYEGELSGELFGDDMPPLQVPLWTLEEIGYTYDAPRVHPDGQLEGGLHSPDYYTYSPQRSSWEDGLQAIESFDWSVTKDPESCDDRRQEGITELEKSQAGATVDHVYEITPNDSSLAVGDQVISDQYQSSRVDTEPNDLAQGVKIDPQLTEKSLEMERGDASSIAPDSAPTISNLSHQGTRIPSTALLETEPQLNWASTETHGQQADSSDVMDIDLVSGVVESDHPSVCDECSPILTPQGNTHICSGQDHVQSDESIIATDSTTNQLDGKDTGISVDPSNGGGLSSTQASPAQIVLGRHDAPDFSQPIVLPYHVLTQSLADAERGDENTMMAEVLQKPDPFTKISSLDSGPGSGLPCTQPETTQQDESGKGDPQYSAMNNSYTRQDSVASAQPLPPDRENNRDGGTSQTDVDRLIPSEMLAKEPTATVSKETQNAQKHMTVSSQSLQLEFSPNDIIAKELTFRNPNCDAMLEHAATLLIIETKVTALASPKPDTATTLESTQSIPSAYTFEGQTSGSHKYSQHAKTSKEESDTDDDMPAKKRQRMYIPAKPHTDIDSKASVASGASDAEVPAEKTKRAKSESDSDFAAEKEVETGEEPLQKGQLTSSRLADSEVGKYSQPLLEPASARHNLTDESIVGNELEQQKPVRDNDIDMTEHYSDVEIADAPTTHNPIAPIIMKQKESRARHLVSTKELTNLFDNTLRSDTKARRTTYDVLAPIPSSRLAPKEHDSRVDATEISSAVANADNASTPKDNGVSNVAPIVEADLLDHSRRPETKKRTSTVVTTNTSGPAPKTAKTALAEKPGKGRKRTNFDDEKKEDTQELPSAAKNEPRMPVNHAKTSTAKNSGKSDPEENTIPFIEHKHPLNVGYGKRHTRSDTKHEQDSAPNSTSNSSYSVNHALTNPKTPTEHSGDSEDELATDWSHAAVANAKAKANTKSKAKTKRKGTANPPPPLLLSLNPPTPSASRPSTPPITNPSPSNTPLAANKYGFTPPRGSRTTRSRKPTTTSTTAAAAPPNAPPARKTSRPTAPKPKAAAKTKAKKVGVDTPALIGDAVVGKEPLPKEVGRRSTRRASAVEEERRVEAREKEKEREGNVKLRLRGRDGE
ncbi:Nn.00g014610.m01.CDS01 [Neocucurbitaria sp. VM-36]